MKKEEGKEEHIPWEKNPVNDQGECWDRNTTVTRLSPISTRVFVRTEELLQPQYPETTSNCFYALQLGQEQSPAHITASAVPESVSAAPPSALPGNALAPVALSLCSFAVMVLDRRSRTARR